MVSGRFKWVRIGDGLNPLPGAEVIVFTPTYGPLRYRLCSGPGLLKTMNDATHWSYLEPPAEYWNHRERV